MLWDPSSLLSIGYWGIFPRRVNRLGREADPLSATSAEAKNAWSYTSTLLYVFMAWCISKHEATLHLLHLVCSFFFLSGVRLSPLGTVATTGLLYQPHMIDGGDCEAVGGMKIGRGNRSTRRKPAPAPLCPSQIPLDQTRVAEVGSQRLTAGAMARPSRL
jgi:hypothetical protein